MIFIDFSCLPYSPVITQESCLEDVHQAIEKITNLNRSYYYLMHGGLPIYEDGKENRRVSGEICVVPRLLGGKGGFGSMLRAIGAQIEKTTNREACRDLSGRRLRDINEEQRLKTWISQQSEREREAEERKRRKLEKLSSQPKHEFKDEDYDKARSQLTEKLFESIEQGLQASTSVKRPTEAEVKQPKKKVKTFLRCEEEDLLSSSDESLDETSVKPSTSRNISEQQTTENTPLEDIPMTDSSIVVKK